ncbi:hypothetical protein L228DRAFT_264716 [Xylona heveae TC161]|uniref:Uncharacterized protein n=1 Tax=Xylona heveae (strain CBS 132557 / TC161) TaxID=1328760 RepID=A0A165JJ06_XYLHT|nr:hypothetical protein L228DRAFT_264716 [Xylona heveae TC161]KZF26303.1 hypothetical protein L228DRAFT_264716 [Xylona heveae TC161]
MPSIEKPTQEPEVNTSQLKSPLHSLQLELQENRELAANIPGSSRNLVLYILITTQSKPPSIGLLSSSLSEVLQEARIGFLSQDVDLSVNVPVPDDTSIAATKGTMLSGMLYVSWLNKEYQPQYKYPTLAEIELPDPTSTTYKQVDINPDLTTKQKDALELLYT